MSAWTKTAVSVALLIAAPALLLASWWRGSCVRRVVEARPGPNARAGYRCFAPDPPDRPRNSVSIPSSRFCWNW